jgi:hypothetical protein
MVARAAKFCTVVPNILGASVWNVVHVTFLATRILNFLLNNWKIFATLVLIIDTFMNYTVFCFYVLYKCQTEKIQEACDFFVSTFGCMGKILVF